MEPVLATASPALAVIAAMARNRVIGAHNRMPWHLSADLKHFRALTTGHRVIMGRKTFASLGKPLPGRENVVVSRDAGFVAPGCMVVRSLGEALAGSTLPPPIFCIGGAQLYAAALPLAREIWLTEIDAVFDGDTFMPPFPADEWRVDSREAAVDAKSGLAYAFVHLSRIRPAALAMRRPSPT
jgi:dihydrofolate reductase